MVGTVPPRDAARIIAAPDSGGGDGVKALTRYVSGRSISWSVNPYVSRRVQCPTHSVPPPNAGETGAAAPGDAAAGSLVTALPQDDKRGLTEL